MKTPDSWILTDDEFMKPSYRISPFSTESIAKNAILELNNACDEYFEGRFPGYKYQYILKARHGITIALREMDLKASDKVAILTTTGNKYVSGCVTKAVEKVCIWEREISSETKCILVVHEFGKVYPDMSAIYNLGIPVIEDFAHSFNSYDPDGCFGDYVIFSFPKYFPIQFGGIILSKNTFKNYDVISSAQTQYIKNTISEHISKIDSIAKIRYENYHYLAKEFEKHSCAVRFEFKNSETPSVFMFVPPRNVDLSSLKIFMQKNGIECSVFYGEHAFFLPAHDRLKKTDMDYFVYVYNAFIKEYHHEN